MKIWDMPFLGTDIDVYHVVHWLLIYSILGWVVESIYMSFCNRKLTNRGFIHGPMCPIYGVGALSVYFILRPLEGNLVALYFCGSFLATLLEYVTAVVMQRIFGCIWWDYNDKPFNYKGILCLESTIAWGFYTLFLFLFLHKWVNSFMTLYSRTVGIYINIALIVYYAIDFTISLIGAIDLNVKLKRLSCIIDEMQEKLKNIQIVPKRGQIVEKLENYIGLDTSILPDIDMKELVEKYRAVRARISVLSKHFVHAYSAIKIWKRKEKEKDEPIEDTANPFKNEQDGLETVREEG